MQTPFVFKLSSLALLGLSLGPLASAQDADKAPDAPRLRVQRSLLPQGMVSATPSLGMLRSAETPRLGVMVESSADGILVNEVQDDSLAAAAGVKSGDLLLSLNGERLAEIGDIGKLLAAVEPGSEFQLGVVRAGEGLVKLEGKRPVAKVKEQAKADGHGGAFLGVTLGDAADGGGVSVGEVYDNTAAWFSGLEAGDVLTKVGDTPVNSASDVAGVVAAQAPGTTIPLAWTRGDAQHTTSVRLGRRNPQTMLYGNQSFPGFVIPEGNARGGAFNLRFPGNGDQDGQVFRWNNHAAPHRLELKELHEHLGDIPQMIDVQKILLDAGINLDELKHGAKKLQIKIDGDKVEVITDGDVKVHELDTSSALNPASNVLYSFSTNADRPTSFGRVLSIQTGSEAECEAKCEASPECEVELDCEAETECEVSAELDEAIEELAAEASDDDLL